MGQNTAKQTPPDNNSSASTTTPQTNQHKTKLPTFTNSFGKEVDAPFLFRDLHGEQLLSNICERIDLDLRDKWTLLYFSDSHGKSFNRFCTHCIDNGPTVVMIRDETGKVFGGFASESWRKASPVWYGSAKSFLYEVKEGKLAVYPASGYNDHYMYLNAGMESMPNGVGMGGQHSFFGWFLSSDFDHGHSNGPCATYESPILSGARDFKTDVIEVWSCKVPPKDESVNMNTKSTESDEEEEGDSDDSIAKLRQSKKKTKKSVLNTENNPDKVILDLLGKTGYSEGLVEPIEEELKPGEKKKVKLNDIGFMM
eukprot:TRINITY_DN2255_c0_g1_i2.p1 TRINITY_DN2255_c0_g1~~TRINITY_DN2255_c0_g1_i2.p1  ORF type:complete len:311 (+),score=41.83 TRINITY_DN2255_c0_g1_i2:203-1135(+)